MTNDATSGRIVTAALTLMLRQGVKRTSLKDVANEAGVTRITVYRYFGNKRGVIAAVCRHLGDIFRRAAEGSPGDSPLDIDSRLGQLGEDFGSLPPGNLLARFEEIRRLHPAAYEELRAVRENSLNQLFDQAITAATRDHWLRDDINLHVARAMFWALVVGLFENPALILANVPYAETCETVIKVLRHGMLKGNGDAKPPRARHHKGK